MSAEFLKKFGIEKPIRTAAVCVYPNRVADAHGAIKKLGLLEDIDIASGKYFLLVAISLVYQN